MHPNNNKYDSKNWLLFLVLTLLLILGWNILFPPAQKANNNTDTPNLVTSRVNDSTAINPNSATMTETNFQDSKEITVTTDNYLAKIDEATGDILYLELLRHRSNNDPNSNMVLLNQSNHYLARSRLIESDRHQFLLEKIPFKTTSYHYQLNNQDTVEVVLTKNTDHISVKKSFLFKKDSYIIDFKYTITNHQAHPLNLTATYSLLHNGAHADGNNTLFTHFYTGPVVYTNDHKFTKISFDDLSEKKASHPSTTNNGWLGIIQHYFATIFLLQPNNMVSVCQNNRCSLHFNQRPSDKLYEVAFNTQLPPIKNNNTQVFSVGLYAGPQAYNTLNNTADNLILVKDYGIWHIFANPLFIGLQFIHSIVANWGWAIIVLVLLLKIILYPLNSSAARSMVKMRQITPKMQKIKEDFGNDKVKMQQEMMELYKKEKINPIGGCLPMLVQIPIFIGLYWALFSSVELRGAPWILWITDLSKPDPYYILPVLMTATMLVQTRLNPPSGDPVQAKMMKILPLVFSIMFFFFPSGLVLYWVVNNIFTILQQWRINALNVEGEQIK